MAMTYRTLGRTGLEVSVVGFGTNELRLVPERQAIATLVRGFELGVNIVHTSPDYEGAEALVARAIAESGRPVIMASQGYDVHYTPHGPVQHFEHLFETTCAHLQSERLALYGIASVDDREAYAENVWGTGGMVEFLLRKKEEGRLGSIFCTTHGDPPHVRRLVESGVFDAIMVSYNPLGYHLLSLSPPPGRHFENMPRNRLEVFPLCRERGVGIMVMMPLAGGLLTDSRAFPARNGAVALPPVAARDVLRTILQDAEVACVLPGTASVEEAEENALAGHDALDVPPDAQQRLTQRVATLQTSHCSRCGACDSLCSQHLPVSWLLRAHDMSAHPGESFETWREVEYFRLHPSLEAICLTCSDVTCGCPAGLDVPRVVAAAHRDMVGLMERGLVAPPDGLSPLCGDATFGARVVSRDVPTRIAPGETRVCRIYLENAGERGWLRDGEALQAGVMLAAFVDGSRVAEARPRDDVHSGGRGYFVFELTAPADAAAFHLRLQMLGEHQGYAEAEGFPVWEGTISVGTEPPLPAPPAAPAAPHRLQLRRPARWLRRLLAGEAVPATEPDSPAAPPPAPASDAPTRPYDVEWAGHNLPDRWMEDEPYHVYVGAVNRGARPWRAAPDDGTAVSLVVRLNREVHAMCPLPHDVGTGERALIGFPLTLPRGLGDWELSFSFVEQNVAWFDQQGVRSLPVRVQRQPAARTPAAEARAVARRANFAFYTPSQGVPRGRDGRAYPILVQEANGARIRDADGNEWIDYVMGWGSALLGYAHPEVRRALAGMLDCGAVVTLPHMLEMEVTQALCELIPCAELVLFGKNGSDACAAAVRAARLHTGRGTVLFSGYHGWQEPFAQANEPALLGPGEPRRAFPFRLNDLEDFCSLVKAHTGDVAAVMLEPAAQVEGVEGPVRDCDPAFLRHVADICREQGAVLIFDEIMTGFRYPRGSVQQATGVVPDLAVFGKAVAAGLSLAALVGRQHILGPALPRLFYHPTFKSETYSFAAAAAALGVYREQDVARQVWQTGERLKTSINALSEELDVDGGMTGLPFRMVYRFHEPDERRRACQRTLLQQELAKRGVLTFRGFMLPSLAHGDREIEETLHAFRAALELVRRVTRDDSFSSALEIPLVY